MLSQVGEIGVIKSYKSNRARTMKCTVGEGVTESVGLICFLLGEGWGVSFRFVSQITVMGLFNR